MPRRPPVRVTVLVPHEVLDRARQRLGKQANVSEAVRRHLAELGGVDPDAYPVKPGRPRKPSTPPEGEAVCA